MEPISKTEFKAHALEVLREIEHSGKSRIITNHGKPTIEIKKLRQREVSPQEKLKNSVLKYEAFDEPVGIDDWKNACLFYCIQLCCCGGLMVLIYFPTLLRRK
jgi:antitoxin (DNA-binding transcriptional repressor) of toxin-antitoxin stability system